MGHVKVLWPAVCSLAPHSQFAEEAKSHLCMDEPKRSTSICRLLSLTQLSWSVKFCQAVKFVDWAARMLKSGMLCDNFRASETIGHLDFSLF